MRASAGDVRYLLFADAMPVESTGARLPRLNVRDPRRIHVVSSRGDFAGVVYRLLLGMTVDATPPSIVDAWLEDGQLVLLSPSFERLAIPLKKITRAIGQRFRKAREFEIDEDGRFIYWPHADVHLGWQQLEQIVDPPGAVVHKRASSDFARRYGNAIRRLRQRSGLRQKDVVGISPRHLRRVESGKQPISRAVLEALARAHRLEIDEYLAKIAAELT